jgi:hypothetical protein
VLVVVGAIATTSPDRPALAQGSTEPPTENQQSGATDPTTHMSEALRSSVKKVVVIAGPSPTKEEITGSYEKTTPGLYGGMAAGSAVGTPPAQIGGINVSFPIPILTIPGMIVGGISGKTMSEMQEFRDALAEDLARADNQLLTNDGLALDVYRGLQSLPGLDSGLFASTTPIPNDADAIMYVSVNEVTIEIEGKEAILTASAGVTLRRPNDEADVYERTVRYQDRDSLSNWTENDNALWRDYANFARHYLGREIAAEVFDRVELRHELRPTKSDTVTLAKKNEWRATSRSTTPTLAWDLTLLGGNTYGSWANELDESDIFYDVEIYDTHRLIYVARQIQDPRHTLNHQIDPCKTYRWSVRPSYHANSEIKFGEWMRFHSEPDADTGTGIVGRNASEAPAYIQDFAWLKIECGRR